MSNPLITPRQALKKMRDMQPQEQVVHPPMNVPLRPQADNSSESIRQLLHNLRGMPTPMRGPDDAPAEPSPTKSVLKR